MIIVNPLRLVHLVMLWLAVDAWYACSASQMPDKLYLGFDVGGALFQDSRVEDSSNPVVSNGQRIRFDPGIRLNLSVGYQFTHALAAELEVGMVDTDVRNSADIPVAGGGSDVFYQVPIMANLVYRYHNPSRFLPFIGVGIGGVDNILEQCLELALFGYSTTSRESDFTLAYQAFGGLQYKLSDKVGVGLLYKMMATTDRNYQKNFGFNLEGAITHEIGLAVTFGL